MKTKEKAIKNFVARNYPSKIQKEIEKECKIIGKKEDFFCINVANELLIIDQKGMLFDADEIPIF